MRALLTALSRLVLRIFFRRIELIGSERVPAGAEVPVLYVLNHPNALIDPLFIVCRSPRPVTFLAKAPLFSTFLIKHFVRGFECLPVYRKQDGNDPKQNRASIEASIALLASGKALALFPEGISHSRPELAPLKTGAARIALSASATTATRDPAPVQIVPVGLDYDDKRTFRSNARLFYGAPILTPKVELDDRERPPEDAAEALTAQISAALGELMLQAKTHELIALVRATARVLRAAERDIELSSSTPDAQAELELERRLVAGHEQLQARAPERLDALVRRVRAFEAELDALGMDLAHPHRLERGRALRWALGRATSLLTLTPGALIGLVTHYPPYRFVDWLAHRVAPAHSQDGDVDDLLATLKLSGGFLLFPLTWIVLALVVGLLAPWRYAALSLALWPLCGFAALRFVERLDESIDRARGAWALLTRRDLGAFIVSERAEIRAEVLALAELV